MENEATDALAAIQETRGKLADRLTTPWWYHPILGALIAQFILVQGLVDHRVKYLSTLVLGLGCAWLIRAYKDRTGLVAGLPPGKLSALLFWAMLAAVGGMAMLVLLAELWPRWVVALAGAAWLCVVIFGRAYDRAYRADLREGDA